MGLGSKGVGKPHECWSPTYGGLARHVDVSGKRGEGRRREEAVTQRIDKAK